MSNYRITYKNCFNVPNKNNHTYSKAILEKAFAELTEKLPVTYVTEEKEFIDGLGEIIGAVQNATFTDNDLIMEVSICNADLYPESYPLCLCGWDEVDYEPSKGAFCATENYRLNCLYPWPDCAFDYELEKI